MPPSDKSLAHTAHLLKACRLNFTDNPLVAQSQDRQLICATHTFCILKVHAGPRLNQTNQLGHAANVGCCSVPGMAGAQEARALQCSTPYLMLYGLVQACLQTGVLQ